MKQLHSLILRGIDRENAGVYRKEKVMIGGAEYIPPDPFLVPQQMDDLIDWYQDEAQNLHPVERAAILHGQFVRIHPFIDGNGRTARLLLNLELMISGYVPIVIKKEQRAEYYQVLDLDHTTGGYSDFIQFIGGILKSTLR